MFFLSIRHFPAECALFCGFCDIKYKEYQYHHAWDMLLTGDNIVCLTPPIESEIYRVTKKRWNKDFSFSLCHYSDISGSIITNAPIPESILICLFTTHFISVISHLVAEIVTDMLQIMNTLLTINLIPPVHPQQFLSN